VFAEAWKKYYDMGLAPIPVIPKDKRPAIEWKKYQKRMPSYEKCSTWAEKSPDGNIGTVTGAVSRIFVVDFDKKKPGEEGIDGIDYFNTIKSQIPKTPVAETGGGGLHVFFRHPGKNIPTKARIWKNVCVDIRGDGGFIVLPPSIHSSGGKYSWRISPDNIEFAEAPQWLLDKIFSDDEAQNQTNITDTIQEGQRNNTLFKLASSLRSQGFSEDTILKQLKITNKKYCNPPLPEKEVQIIAGQVGKYEPGNKRKEEAIKKKMKKKDDEKEPVLSFIGNDYHIEEIMDNGVPKLLVLSNGEYDIKDEYHGMIPDCFSGILEGHVRLPTGIEEYGNVNTLVSDIQRHIHTYIDIPPMYEKLFSYYVLLTWLFPGMNIIPIISFLGPLGRGKTQALQTIGGLCYHCNMCLLPSTAVTYRIIERTHPTFCFDEGTFREGQSDRDADYIQLLNAGIQKGVSVPRCGPNDFEPEYFNVFCPKVIGRHERYDDPALESRCITVEMRETERDDVPLILPPIFFEEQESLCRKLLKFRFDYYHRIDWDVNDRLIELRKKGHTSRVLQMASAFFALSPYVEGCEKTVLEYIIQAEMDLEMNKAESLTGMVIHSLAKRIRQKTRDYGLKGCIDVIITPGELRNGIEDDYGEKISTRKIGRILGPLGIKTKSKRVGDDVIRCYDLPQNLCNKIVTNMNNIVTNEDYRYKSCNDNDLFVTYRYNYRYKSKTENLGDLDEISNNNKYNNNNNNKCNNVTISGGRAPNTDDIQEDVYKLEEKDGETVTPPLSENIVTSLQSDTFLKNLCNNYLFCESCGAKLENKEKGVYDSNSGKYKCWDCYINKKYRNKWNSNRDQESVQ